MRGRRAGHDARWLALLDDALTGDGVDIEVQPIVDIVAGRTDGYEALARFEHEDAEGVGPDVWFQRAREHDLLAELQAAAAIKALALMSRLATDRFIAINVEPDALSHPAVRAALLDHGDLSRIAIELNEHAEWHWETMAPTIAELRARGASFGMDDAGTGAEGIAHLESLAPVYVKVHRDVVGGIAGDPARIAVLGVVQQFSARVDAGLVGVGVERLEDALALRSLGVRHAQGYALSPPAAPWPEADPAALGRLALGE